MHFGVSGWVSDLRFLSHPPLRLNGCLAWTLEESFVDRQARQYFPAWWRVYIWSRWVFSFPIFFCVFSPHWMQGTHALLRHACNTQRTVSYNPCSPECRQTICLILDRYRSGRSYATGWSCIPVMHTDHAVFRWYAACECSEQNATWQQSILTKTMYN